MFYICHQWTTPLRLDSGNLDVGGNGNPAFFPLALSLPFLALFLYKTTVFCMEYVGKYTRKLRSVVLVVCFITISIIVTTIYVEANRLRKIIYAHTDSDVHLSLLNSFSNAIFFNASTFVLVLFVCLFTGTALSFGRKNISLSKVDSKRNQKPYKIH